MTTQTHDSTTCTAGVDGQKCEICLWAAGSIQNPQPDPYSLFRASEASSGQEIANQPVLAVVDTPDFEQEWAEAPAHLKPVFHPSLIRAAVFDVLDAGWNKRPWHLDPRDESEAQTNHRVAFVDAVIARLLEIRRISGECDPSSEYFYLRGERAGRIAQMMEENRVFRAMAERRGLTQ